MNICTGNINKDLAHLGIGFLTFLFGWGGYRIRKIHYSFFVEGCEGVIKRTSIVQDYQINFQMGEL